MVKKYSLNVEGFKVVSVEVDGIQYKNARAIRDEADRAKIETLVEALSDMEFLTTESGSAKMMKIIFGVFLAVTVLALAIFAITAVNTARAIAREESAPGVVVALDTRTSSDGSQYAYPVVEMYLPDKSVQTVEINEGSWPPAYAVGDQVTVLYDPENPLEGYIQSTGSAIARWTLSIISGVIGLSFLAATLFTRSMMKPNPAALQRSQG